jgi:hypothetical protein
MRPIVILLLLAGAARADTCKDVEPLGPGLGYRFDPGRHTEEGRDDRTASVRFVTVAKDACAPGAAIDLGVGARVWLADPGRQRLFISYPDDRFAAWLTFGLFALDAAGARTPLVAGMLNELRCEGRRDLFVAPVRTARKGEHEWDNADFSLVLVDLRGAGAPVVRTLASGRFFARFGEMYAEDALGDGEEMPEDGLPKAWRRSISFSPGCEELRYRTSEKGKQKVVRL